MQLFGKKQIQFFLGLASLEWAFPFYIWWRGTGGVEGVTSKLPSPEGRFVLQGKFMGPFKRIAFLNNQQVSGRLHVPVVVTSTGKICKCVWLKVALTCLLSRVSILLKVLSPSEQAFASFALISLQEVCSCFHHGFLNLMRRNEMLTKMSSSQELRWTALSLLREGIG